MIIIRTCNQPFFVVTGYDRPVTPCIDDVINARWDESPINKHDRRKEEETKEESSDHKKERISSTRNDEIGAFKSERVE